MDDRQSPVKTQVQVVFKIVPQLAPEPTNWKSLIYRKSSSHFEDVKCVLVSHIQVRQRWVQVQVPSVTSHILSSKFLNDTYLPCRGAVRTRTLDRCSTLASFLACHSKPYTIQPNLQHFPPTSYTKAKMRTETLLDVILRMEKEIGAAALKGKTIRGRRKYSEQGLWNYAGPDLNLSCRLPSV